MPYSSVNPIDIAYGAGLVDGEGYVSVRQDKPTRRQTYIWRACITINMTTPAPLYWMSATFGGSVRCVGQRNGQKMIYRWDVYGTHAANICRMLLPYLKVKGEQATLIVRLYDEGVWQRGKRLTDSEIQRRHGIHEQVRRLNHRGTKPMKQVLLRAI